MLDSYQTLDGRSLKPNKEKLYIGGHPSYSAGCQMAYYIDNLKVHSRVATESSVEAESYGTLGPISANQIMLGCLDCDFVDAKNACILNYHLCTNVEMASGVNQAIRIMGWVTSSLLST